MRASPCQKGKRRSEAKKKIRGRCASVGITEKKSAPRKASWNLDPLPTLDDSRRPRPVRVVPRAHGKEKNPGFFASL